ncbi:MAG: four helix bundle protein [Chitinophagales bacterium]
MSQKSILKQKSFQFALHIVSLARSLSESKSAPVISTQILRSGTSIGAMIREAEHAESKSDFIHKLSVALKEANETLYWLELLCGSGYISNSQFQVLLNENDELVRMLVSSIKTLKSKEH